MGIYVTGYLLIGAVFAASIWFVVWFGIKHAHHSEIHKEVQSMEQAVGVFPGGMVGVLTAALLIWPLFVMLAVKQRIGR